MTAFCIYAKAGYIQSAKLLEKIFVGKEMRYCSFGGKEEISKEMFTVIYRKPETRAAYIKKCRIESYILNKDYFFVSDGM